MIWVDDIGFQLLYRALASFVKNSFCRKLSSVQVVDSFSLGFTPIHENIQSLIVEAVSDTAEEIQPSPLFTCTVYTSCIFEATNIFYFFTAFVCLLLCFLSFYCRQLAISGIAWHRQHEANVPLHVHPSVSAKQQPPGLENEANAEVPKTAGVLNKSLKLY